jgi:hypothetical protein
MTESGIYHRDAHVRHYSLAAGWIPQDESLLDGALERALSAWDGREKERVRTYYDPTSDYAGGLLTQTPEADPGSIDAADLFAVTTLSMRTHPKVARALVTENSATRQALTRALNPAVIPTALPITALDQAPGEPGAMLAALETAYLELRSARTTTGNAWVFAAKMCARKRPYLAPVRDNIVCELLNGRPLQRGGIGTFSVDMQVFAYSMSSGEMTARLRELREDVSRKGVTLEASDLRLLDVVLWTKGIGHWSMSSTTL